MGHSVGELAAACVAGVFSLDDGLRLAACRGRLMQELPAGGAMAAVFGSPEQVLQAIAAHRHELSLAAINGAEDVTLSGREETLRKVLIDLRASGIASRLLPVKHAFHSPLMDPIREPFAGVTRQLGLRPPRIGFVSNVSGERETEAVVDPGYWWSHVRRPVQFARGLSELREAGCEVFVEIGPNPTLCGLGRRTLGDDAIRWVPSLRAGRPQRRQLLESAGALYRSGIAPSPPARRAAGRFRRLPTYPFQRQRHWIATEPTGAEGGEDAARSTAAGLPASGYEHPLLGRRLPELAAAPRRCTWQVELDTSRIPFVVDHRIQGAAVVPGALYVEMAAAAVGQLSPPPTGELQEIEYSQVLFLPEQDLRTVQVSLERDADGSLRFTIHSRASGSEEPWLLHSSGRFVDLDEPADQPSRTRAQA